MPTADELTEAFLWSEYRVVTKTATVSLHANTYQVDAALVGRKVELVFSPFDLETVEVRYRDKSYRESPAAHHLPPRPPESPTRDPRARAAGWRPGSTTWR